MFFLLADDHSLFREGMAHILQSNFPTIAIIQVNSWYDTHTTISKQQFDLAFIDLTMPGQIAWEDELRQVLTITPTLPVCVISASDSKTDRRKVYEMGAAGFFHKSMSILEIKQNITQLLAGERVFPNVKEIAIASASRSPLTLRQRDIMHLLAKGYCNKIIAKELKLSEGTVKRHFSNIFSTLNAKNRVDALRIMQQQNW